MGGSFQLYDEIIKFSAQSPLDENTMRSQSVDSSGPSPNLL